MSKSEGRSLRIRAGVKLHEFGKLVAEQDATLDKYYVEPEKYVHRALDIEDPAVFYMGPKGIGKSAVLQMVRLVRVSDSQRLIEITPDDLAFSSLANIQSESPLLQDAKKNQWLFTSLWDYIFVIEILRREFPDSQGLWNIFSRLFSGKEEKEAKRLLRVSLGDDGSPRSITQRILEIAKEVEIKASGYGVNTSLSLRGDSSSRGERLHLLSQINQAAKTLPELLKHQYFVLIDDLDLHWTDTETQNEFIAALFTSIKKLSKPPNLKFLVAIREDIFGRLPLEDKDKLRDRVCKIGWDREGLRKILEYRISSIIDCTMPTIWNRVFEAGAFDALLGFTNSKPRELIRLTLLAIESAISKGHCVVGLVDIYDASRAFAAERLEDLGSEKRHWYPNVELFLKRFTGSHKEFGLSHIEDIVLRSWYDIENHVANAAKYTWTGGYVDKPKEMAKILLDIGFLLFKASRTATAQRFDPDAGIDIDGKVWFAINPMYAPALNLKGA